VHTILYMYISQCVYGVNIFARVYLLWRGVRSIPCIWKVEMVIQYFQSCGCQLQPGYRVLYFMFTYRIPRSCYYR
jgi:hypothetical protein